MKNLTILIMIMLVSVACYSQQDYSSSRIASAEPYPTNIQRYNIDYIVVNYNFQGDSTILNQIDLDKLEYYRKGSERVEITDKVTGLNVILFAREELREKSANIDTQNSEK